MYYTYGWTWALMIIATVFTLYAQFKVSHTYRKYARRANCRGMTGTDAARRIMAANGINLPIEVISGSLTDHYDPSAKVLRLSSAVANDTSIASVAVAAHEVGHALQHASGYAPLRIRGAIVPVVNISSKLAIPLIIIGLAVELIGNVSGAGIIVDIGVILFAAVVAFHMITLPVELNASSRALQQIEALDIVTAEERKGAKKMLRAAAMTYVAAMATAVVELVRLITIAREDS